MRILEEFEWDAITGGLTKDGGSEAEILGHADDAVFGIVMANINDFTSVQLANTVNGTYVTAGGFIGDIRKAFLAAGYRVSDRDIMRGNVDDPDWLASVKIN